VTAGSTFAPRLRRMLVMIPWLLSVGGSTVEELAERFGISEDEVVRDLSLVMCCGVPPYGAEQLISVVLDEDGSVLAWQGPHFNRPMRLTPTEGFAVLAAGRTLLAVPGAEPTGALAGALAKLEAVLGSADSVSVELETPPLLDVVRAAASRGERLRVTSYSAWRDEVGEREIDPWLVFSREGRWYVVAGDVRSGESRHFRIDRLSTIEATGEVFPRPEGVRPPERLFSGGAETVEVLLDLPPAARWVVETYESIAVDEVADARLHVRATPPPSRPRRPRPRPPRVERHRPRRRPPPPRALPTGVLEAIAVGFRLLLPPKAGIRGAVTPRSYAPSGGTLPLRPRHRD